MRLLTTAFLALGVGAPCSAFTTQSIGLEGDFCRKVRSSRSKSFQIATVSDETTAGAAANRTLSDDDGATPQDFDVEGSDMLIPKSKFSKAKWKKKKFLLIQDVKKLIEQNNPNAPKKAEAMVRRMRTLYEKSGGDSDLRPTLQAYNLWIHALAKSNKANAGQLAEDVLEQIHAHDITPDVITYTSIMDAHAKSCDPDRAEEVLFRLLDSTVIGKVQGQTGVSSITCDTILNAWAQQGTYESAERAQMILFRLEEWGRNDIRPTEVSYSTVMNAWAKVGSTDAAEHAEALLNRMLKKNEVKPDTVVFNAAINAWATSKDEQGGKRALAILKQMKTLAKEGIDSDPDIVTYNTVLSAWSHSGDENAAPYAERIVRDMQTAAAENDNAPAPNTVTYNTILNAWSKSKLPGSAPRAQKVLDFMIKSENDAIAPDVISFASVLDAWAKSKEPHKSAMCRDLLDKLLDMYGTSKRQDLQPTPYTYNAVLNACAFSAMGTTMEEQREALEIAVRTFSSMRKSETEPDTVTYGNMLKCLANLMPDGEIRSSMALQIFDKCKSDGLVGALTWNEVRRAVPAKQIQKAYSLKGLASNVQVRDLPRSWKRSNRFDKNAPQKKRKQTNEHATSQPTPTAMIIETSVQSGRDL
jgi:pentatricopeptide repeat protein